MFKIGMGFPKARPYVAEGLASLITDVVGDNVPGAVDTVLTTDHDQIVSGWNAHCLGGGGVAVKLCGIEIAD